MSRDETGGGIRIAELVRQLRDELRPVCPQFRPYKQETRYPGRGHCIPLHRLGCLIIPSIDEYGRYCTRPTFAACPWFRAVDAAHAEEGGPHAAGDETRPVGI